MGNNTDNEIVIKFVKAINDHDVDEIFNLASEDYIFIDALGNKSVGKKSLKEGWSGYYELFPDYQIEIVDIIESENVFGLFGFAGGTYKNIKDEANSNYWKIPASWKAIVENNKIKHWQVYCDYSSLFKITDKNK